MKILFLSKDFSFNGGGERMLCNLANELASNHEITVISFDKSDNEGFGRMTAEVNTLGVPVIGRNTAGTKEILDQTYGGFRFSTVEELVGNMKVVAEMNAIQICWFMKEPERRAKELFSTDNHVKYMMQLYGKVTGVGYSCRVVCQNSWFSSLAAA